MKKYLSELHTKSPSHKKRFALAASGGVTLIIFAIWASVKFGGEPVVVKDTTGPVNLAATVQAGPIENVWDDIRDTWDDIRNLNGQ